MADFRIIQKKNSDKVEQQAVKALRAEYEITFIVMTYKTTILGEGVQLPTTKRIFFFFFKCRHTFKIKIKNQQHKKHR